MTKTKLSELEKLRERKALLLDESNVLKEQLSYNWDYTKSHFGKLLLGSTVSSTKGGISDIFSLISGKKDENSKPSATMNLLTSTAPVIWSIAQPMIWGLLVKKIKSAFTRKKKKKQKKITNN